MSPAWRWVAWLLPLLVCVGLYWPVFDTWYQQDDFAWLGLTQEVYSWRDLPRVMFEPRAQGTIRPWSERLTFMVSRTLFDLNPLPFRLWVFATMFANLLLLQAITRRLTGSALAGVAAPILWLVSPGLGTPMSWASSYNQIQCGFVLLLAFYLLLKHIETGKSAFWYGQVAVFVLGFGTLEIVVVYPAIAIAYCWLFSRRHVVKALWLLIPSALYTALHFKVAPKPKEGVYAQHWDLSIIKTYLRYGKAALAALPVSPHWGLPGPFWQWVFAGVALAVLGFVAVRLWNRDFVPLFGLAWFTTVLLPVLPLRDHFSEYYLAVPAAGLALVLGAMLAQARQQGVAAVAAFAVVAAGYAGLCWPTTRSMLVWRHGLGQVNRLLVLGVREAQKAAPGKTILLTGVNSEAFWFGIYDNPFRLLADAPVKLVPGAEKSIDAHPELGEIPPFIAPQGVARRLLQSGQAVVLDIAGKQVVDVTSQFRDQVSKDWIAEPVRSLDLGQTMYDDLLSGDWYPAEAGYRWMGKRAEVKMAGPGSASDVLRLSGECPSQQFEKGPLHLAVTIAGKKAGTVEIIQNKPRFEFAVPFPAAAVGQRDVQVSLEVERTFQVPNDPRTLGITFGQLEVVPPITQK